MRLIDNINTSLGEDLKGTGSDEDFVKRLAAHKPLREVFRDAGFVSDSVKINAEQVFKLLSPATEIRTL